jgi:hypothetical protein
LTPFGFGSQDLTPFGFDRVEASEAGGYSGGGAGELIYEVVEK